MSLSHAARPNITINSSTELKGSVLFTKVDCSVDSVASAAAITWHVGNTDNSINSSLSEPEVRADGLVSARSSVRFLSSLYAGQNLTCVVEHPSLEASEIRTIHIPVHSTLLFSLKYFCLWHTQPHMAAHLLPVTPCFLSEAPLLSVSVARQRDSHLWLAVCDCKGEGFGTNLAWVLPENVKGQTSLHSEYEGRALKARLTYQFPLDRHEGQDLTCEYRSEHGNIEKKTVRIPRYCEFNRINKAKINTSSLHLFHM